MCVVLVVDSGIDSSPQKKYNKITSLAKTLQEDPSCQLLTVLRLYIKKVGIEAIEQNINVDTIPQLITIQKASEMSQITP